MKKVKTFRVEAVSLETNKVVAVIGKGLTEKLAERREVTGLLRFDTNQVFIRSVEEK